MELDRYVIGIDPTSDEASIAVIQICNKNMEPIITKVNPVVNPYKINNTLKLSLEEVLETYKDLLTEEEINKLREYGK